MYFSSYEFFESSDLLLSKLIAIFFCDGVEGFLLVGLRLDVSYRFVHYVFDWRIERLAKLLNVRVFNDGLLFGNGLLDLIS